MTPDTPLAPPKPEAIGAETTIVVQERHRGFDNHWYDDPDAPCFEDFSGAITWLHENVKGGHGEVYEHRIILRTEEVYFERAMSTPRLSKCCSAPVNIVAVDEGTHYHECSKCYEPCDVLVDEPAMTDTPTPLSNCCHAAVAIIASDEGTHYHECPACHQPCDVASDTPRTDCEWDHPGNFDLDNLRAERLGKPQIVQVVPADFARQLERELAASESIRHAEKQILIDEVAAHTETKRELAAAKAELEKAKGRP